MIYGHKHWLLVLREAAVGVLVGVLVVVLVVAVAQQDRLHTCHPLNTRLQHTLVKVQAQVQARHLVRKEVADMRVVVVVGQDTKEQVITVYATLARLQSRHDRR
jgi:hypothetical protein